MKRIVLFMTAVFLALPSQVFALTPFVKIDSFSHSEPIAVHGIFNDWQGDLSGGNKAFSINRVEVGVGYENWRVSIFSRQDYFYRFSSNTAKLFYDTNNTKNLVPGEVYDIYLDSNSFAARGTKLGYSGNWNNIKFNVNASYLEGTSLTDGRINGSATAITSNDYDFDFDVDYYYSEDVLFDRKLGSRPTGEGYSFDLGFEWDIDEKWSVGANVEDLFGQISWYDTPRTIASGTTGTKQYDEDGFVVFKPVASGLETNKNYTQYLPTKVFLNGQYHINSQHDILFDYADYSLKSFSSIGYRYNFDKIAFGEIHYDLTTSSIQIQMQNHWLKLGVISDSFDIEKAKTVGINLALQYHF